MSISLQTANPNETLATGRTKLDANDTAIAAELATVVGDMPLFEGEADHSGRYYTKAEIDGIVDTEAGEYYLEFVVQPPGLYFSNIPVDLTGIPIIGAATLVGMTIAAADGSRSINTIGSGNSFADGDVLSLAWSTLDSPDNGFVYDIGFTFLKNGVGTGPFHLYVNTWPQDCVVIFRMRKV